MNAADTIFALALASNFNPKVHLTDALQGLSALGQLQCSAVFEIPCRNAVGADYWNCACLLHAPLSVDDLTALLQQLEQHAGRVRPSHQISLDVDLIAWGSALDQMQFNLKKCPLALDVKIPLSQLWKHPDLHVDAHHFRTLDVF